jgi:hypothetical protein
MSDPVTNADIEDVLSSIRRLVAEDERPDVVAPSTPAASDRLVLTPALRVMETEAPEEMVSADTADLVDEDDSTETDLPEPELVEGHELADLDVDDSAKRNLEARIAELEAVISDTGGQWEQDGEEGSANAGGAVDSLNWSEDESEPDPEIEEAQMAELVEEDMSGADTVAAMPFLRHKFSVPDENAAEPETASEPDAGSDLDEEEASVDEPEVDAEVQAEFQPEIPEPDPVPEMAAEPVVEDINEEPYDGQDFVVDEEALRALVVEIVHQELQGKLGERITRNVRNLVRREIHRALTSQELE